MIRTGIVDLGLHEGHVPPWLLSRMRRLADAIICLLVGEYGTTGALAKLSDCFWFQALAAVLGFDFDSSGVTSVTCGVLKAAVKPSEHGIGVAGGKGKLSKQTPKEITSLAELFGLPDAAKERMVYSSRMAAKVDNAAVQDGYQLYHHAFFLSEKGDWAIIQQGMNPDLGLARRYHWASKEVKSFVVEPHGAIIGQARHRKVLNMTAKESEGARKASVDLAKDLNSLRRERFKLVSPSQASLDEWLGGAKVKVSCGSFIPSRINWKALERVYDFSPRNYEELLAVRGVGPSTVRALALISELIYGEKPSWRDPVKFSWAFGGKDGVPYPVNVKTMDEAVEFLSDAIKQASLENGEKAKALRRLKSFTVSRAEPI